MGNRCNRKMRQNTKNFKVITNRKSKQLEHQRVLQKLIFPLNDICCRLLEYSSEAKYFTVTSSFHSIQNILNKFNF